MLLWSFIYGVPTAAMLFLWTAFFTRNRDQRNRVSAWFAMAGATLPGLAGVYALTHVYRMAERAPTDYRFEKVSLVLAILGAVSAILWLRRSRQMCSWGSLGVSVWLALVWTAVLNPF